MKKQITMIFAAIVFTMAMNFANGQGKWKNIQNSISKNPTIRTLQEPTTPLVPPFSSPLQSNLHTAIKPPLGIKHPAARSIREKVETELMLGRYLHYIRIDQIRHSQGGDKPLSNGQRMADSIYSDLLATKGNNIEVKLTPEVLLVKVSSNVNVQKQVPSVMIITLLDTTTVNGPRCIPHVQRHYDGGDIWLGNGITFSANSDQSSHLKDLTGKTIVTYRTCTPERAECLAKCTIMTTLIMRLAIDTTTSHGDIYFCYCLSPNMDTTLMEQVSDMKIDLQELGSLVHPIDRNTGKGLWTWACAEELMGMTEIIFHTLTTKK